MEFVFPYKERKGVDLSLFPQHQKTGHPVPFVPMRLFKGKAATPFMDVLVDSGADYAMFHSSVAGLLGIDYTAGFKTSVLGVGKAECWMHDDFGLAIRQQKGSSGVAIKLRVAFMPDLAATGLVGREFFFEAFVVTFDEVAREVRLTERADAPNLVDWSEVPIFKPPIPLKKRSHKQGRPRK